MILCGASDTVIWTMCPVECIAIGNELGMLGLGALLKKNEITIDDGITPQNGMQQPTGLGRGGNLSPL